MRRAAVACLAALACRAPATESSLLSEVKRTLAERSERLGTYSFKAAVEPAGGAAVTYALVFREPTSTRVDLAAGSLSFDGRRFYERDDGTRALTVYAPQLSKEKLALGWSTTFGSRVPEGFRAPLLPPKGVTATRRADAVELEFRTRDEGTEVSVISVLKWPGGDFLERRTDYGGARGAVRMEQEHCDAALQLCVPTQLSRWQGQAKVETTTLKELTLGGAPAPQEDFVLAAPPGYAVKRSELVPGG